ncbi:MAG TPA: TRAP transporter small permease [Clostridia bacterium]|nr:TRAP transporter small permease [Clostridia bacterium]
MKSFDRIVEKVEEAILGYSVLLMAFILIGSVLSRTLLNSSWTFAEEVGQTLTIVVTFLGIGYAAKKAKHITMSAIFDLMGVKGKKVFQLVISSVTSLCLFYLTYLGLKYTIKVFQLGRVTPALRIPMYLIMASVPLGFFLGAVEYGRTFIKNMREKDVYVSTQRTIYQIGDAYEYNQQQGSNESSTKEVL